MNQDKFSIYKNNLSKMNQLKRFVWNLVWLLFARPLPRSVGSKWKLFLLSIFGAKVHKTVKVYSSVRIYSPWNLEMKEYSCLAPEVNCYNVDKIIIGAYVTISQNAHLCTASHDINNSNNPLVTAPIIIEDKAWIAADSFIGMGVIIGKGAVVGARACVFKNVEPWSVVGGNPSKVLKKRQII